MNERPSSGRPKIIQLEVVDVVVANRRLDYADPEGRPVWCSAHEYARDAFRENAKKGWKDQEYSEVQIRMCSDFSLLMGFYVSRFVDQKNWSA